MAGRFKTERQGGYTQLEIKKGARGALFVNILLR